MAEILFMFVVLFGPVALIRFTYDKGRQHGINETIALFRKKMIE